MCSICVLYQDVLPGTVLLLQNFSSSSGPQQASCNLKICECLVDVVILFVPGTFSLSSSGDQIIAFSGSEVGLGWVMSWEITTWHILI